MEASRVTDTDKQADRQAGRQTGKLANRRAATHKQANRRTDV